MSSTIIEELRRKLFHCIFGIIFPIIIFLFNKQITSIIVSILLLTIAISELIRLNSDKYNIFFQTYFKFFMREFEFNRPIGSVYFLSGVLISINMFSMEISFLSLIALIFGDTAASLVGRRYGRIKVLDKSLEGTFAFVSVTFIFMTIFNAILFGNMFSILTLLIVSIISSVIELISKGNSDNILIPIGTGLILTFIFI